MFFVIYLANTYAIFIRNCFEESYESGISRTALHLRSIKYTQDVADYVDIAARTINGMRVGRGRNRLVCVREEI